MAGNPSLEMPKKARTARRVPRHRVDALMYLDLGADNGGFPINISEDGLAFQGIRPMQQGEDVAVTFKLDGIEEPVTANARIVWLTDSRKAGAVQFIDFPEVSRQLIRNWIATEEEKERTRQRPPAATLRRLGSKPAGKNPDAPAAPAESKPAPASETVPAALAQDHFAVTQPDVTQPVETRPVEQPVAKFERQPEIPFEIPAPRMIFDTSSEVTRSQSLLHAQTSAAPLQMPARSRVAPVKKKKSRYGVAGICLAVALSALAAGTAGLWPFHEDLQREMAPAFDEIKAKLDSLSERVKLIALHRASGNAPQTGNAGEESVHLSAVESEWDKFQDLPLAASRNSVQLNPLTPLRNSAAIAQTARREPVSIPVAPKAEISAPKPAAAAVESVKQVSATSVQVVTSQVEVAGMQANAPVAAKASPVETKVAVSPAAATATVEIIPDLYPSIRMSQDAAKRPSTQGTTLQIGRLVSKVEPVYPAEALRERLAGSVKLHVVIGRNGSVTAAELLDGSAVLAESALRAVQQWRYEPTLLGGAPVEMEEEIRLVFRISGTQTAAN